MRNKDNLYDVNIVVTEARILLAILIDGGQIPSFRSETIGRNTPNFNAYRISLGIANECPSFVRLKGYVDNNGKITDAGYAFLKEYEDGKAKQAGVQNTDINNDIE